MVGSEDDLVESFTGEVELTFLVASGLVLGESLGLTSEVLDEAALDTPMLVFFAIMGLLFGLMVLVLDVVLEIPALVFLAITGLPFFGEPATKLVVLVLAGDLLGLLDDAAMPTALLDFLLGKGLDFGE